MTKILSILWMFFFTTTHVMSEELPAPANDATRHYLNIPKDGLTAFLKRPAFPIPMISHHRGGPAPGYPENAIETMDNALKYGYGFMEVDVAQLRDGTLVLMHDDTLGRTTTGTGQLAAKTWEEVSAFYLKDSDGAVTSFRVPRLRDALLWAKGKTILTLDIKRGVDFKKVNEMVVATSTQDYAAAIAYSMKQAMAFHRLAPWMPMSVTLANADDIQAFDQTDIPDNLVIAWTGTRLNTPEHYKVLHQRGWRVMMGTLGGSDRSIDNQIKGGQTNITYKDIIDMGVDVIATDRFWAVQAEIGNPNVLVFNQQAVAIPARNR